MAVHPFWNGSIERSGVPQGGTYAPFFILLFFWEVTMAFKSDKFSRTIRIYVRDMCRERDLDLSCNCNCKIEVLISLRRCLFSANVALFIVHTFDSVNLDRIRQHRDLGENFVENMTFQYDLKISWTFGHWRYIIFDRCWMSSNLGSVIFSKLH